MTTLQERCAISEQCLPDAPYRAMLTRLHAEMLTRINDLDTQVAALTKALNGFIANSCRVDWPADIYDAALAAQKGTP